MFNDIFSSKTALTYDFQNFLVERFSEDFQTWYREEQEKKRVKALEEQEKANRFNLDKMCQESLHRVKQHIEEEFNKHKKELCPFYNNYLVTTVDTTNFATNSFNTNSVTDQYNEFKKQIIDIKNEIDKIRQLEKKRFFSSKRQP